MQLPADYLRLLWRTSVYFLLMFWRQPLWLAIGVLFALGMLYLIGQLFSGLEDDDPNRTVLSTFAVWEAAWIALTFVSLTMVPTGMAQLRSALMLKIFRSSPLTRSQVVFAFMLAHALLFAIILAIMLVLGVIFYGVFLPDVINVVLVLSGLLFGAAALFALGTLLGTIIRINFVIPILGFMLFLPGTMLSYVGLSGMERTLDSDDIPLTLKIIIEVLPTTHLARLVSGLGRIGSSPDGEALGLVDIFVLFETDTLDMFIESLSYAFSTAHLISLGILAAWFSVCTALTFLLMKWD